MLRRTLSALALLSLTLPPLSEAQRPVIKANSVTETVTITQIDRATRRITVKDDKGEEETVVAGPAVQRFDELKPGSKVQMRYYESLVFSMHPAKQAPKPTSATVDITSSAGTPGATAATQAVTTVTVTAVDMKTPSITVKTDDGRVVTRKVENRKNLESVKVGSQIDITYTEAVILEVLAQK